MVRTLAFALFLTLSWCSAAVPGLSLRGKLEVSPSGEPTLAQSGGRVLHLHGDASTELVLRDKRLAGSDLEAIGHFEDPTHFEVDPIHTRALFVLKDGKRLAITYWCDVCYIRTYAPGNCWCCQKYTDLDLRDPGDPVLQQ